MRFKLLSYAFANLKRRKKSLYINIIIMTISLFLLLLIITFSTSVDRYLNKYLFNTLNYRTLNINIFKYQLENIDILEKIAREDDRIIDIFKENYGAYVKISNLDELKLQNNKDKYFGYVSLIPYTKSNKDFIIKGYTIKNNDKNIGIIPKKFYPGSFNGGFWREDINYIDGESLMGKTVTIEYYARDYSTEEMKVIKTFTYTFKVVGVYDILANENAPYDVLIPINDVEHIIRDLNTNNLGLAETFNIDYSIVVDDQKNVSDVIAKLVKNGLMGMPKSQLGPFGNISKAIIQSGIIISVVILFIGLIQITLSVLKTIKERVGEIGLLKAIGYQNHQLLIIQVSEMVIIGIISFCLSVILYSIVMVIINKTIYNNFSIYLKQLKFIVPYSQIFKNFLISIIIPLISSLWGISILFKISPMDALKGRRDNY